MDRKVAVPRLLQVTWAALISAWCVFALSSCRHSYDIVEIVGIYEANFGFCVVTLDVGESTYQQSITFTDSTRSAVHHSAKWRYDSKRNAVFLDSPLIPDDNFGKINPNIATPAIGAWVLTFVSGKERKLVWDDDAGVEFVSK